MANAQRMAAQDYRQWVVAGVVRQPDFATSDEDFFAGNGRLHRLRPPWDSECTPLITTLEELGSKPFLLLARKSMESPSRTLAVLALDEPTVASLIADCRAAALHVSTQAELDLLHKLVREGRPLPLKPAPGSKQPKR